jgi:hypothetical protein
MARAVAAAGAARPGSLLPRAVSLPVPPARRRAGTLDYVIGLAPAGTRSSGFPDNPGQVGAVPRHTGNPGYSGTLTVHSRCRGPGRPESWAGGRGDRGGHRPVPGGCVRVASPAAPVSAPSPRLVTGGGTIGATALPPRPNRTTSGIWPSSAGARRSPTATLAGSRVTTAGRGRARAGGDGRARSARRLDPAGPDRAHRRALRPRSRSTARGGSLFVVPIDMYRSVKPRPEKAHRTCGDSPRSRVCRSRLDAGLGAVSP